MKQYYLLIPAIMAVLSACTSHHSNGYIKHHHQIIAATNKLGWHIFIGDIDDDDDMNYRFSLAMNDEQRRDEGLLTLIGVDNGTLTFKGQTDSGSPVTVLSKAEQCIDNDGRVHERKLCVDINGRTLVGCGNEHHLD